MMRIAFVVAMARNHVIGRNNGLPWRIPADLRHFKALTLGKPVIMGRKTYQSIGRPLPERDNIVITRDPAFSADGVRVVHDLEAALRSAKDSAEARSVDEVAIIGGAQIYAQALPMVDRIYLTEIDAEPEGDAFFPNLIPEDWRETAREAHAAVADQPGFSFIVLDRRR